MAHTFFWMGSTPQLGVPRSIPVEQSTIYLNIRVLSAKHLMVELRAKLVISFMNVRIKIVPITVPCETLLINNVKIGIFKD